GAAAVGGRSTNAITCSAIFPCGRRKRNTQCTQGRECRLKEKAKEYPILFWTLVVTAIGVGAGIIALVFAGVTIHLARKEARENVKTPKPSKPNSGYCFARYSRPTTTFMPTFDQEGLGMDPDPTSIHP